MDPYLVEREGAGRDDFSKSDKKVFAPLIKDGSEKKRGSGGRRGSLLYKKNGGWTIFAIRKGSGCVVNRGEKRRETPLEALKKEERNPEASRNCPRENHCPETRRKKRGKRVQNHDASRKEGGRNAA